MHPQALQTQQVRLSEESLLDFLQSTGVPLVSRLGSMVQRATLLLLIASFGYGLFALAFWRDGLWSAQLPWSGALPSLVTAPMYFGAWRLARADRLQWSAMVLFGGLLAFSALASWPHGALHPAWYVQPILALLATCCLGVVPGLVLTLLAVACLLSAPTVPPGTGTGLAGLVEVVEVDVWLHTVSLTALTLASALTGVLVHKVLLAALVAVETQRRLNAEHARALRYREKLLRHALRVETVGDLAGLVTHQLRNAFQVMIGHVTLGAMGGADQIAERLTLVGETLQQSRPLLDQLMSLAHPDDGAPEFGDLGEWTEAFAERARRVVPASIRIELSRHDGAMPVLLSARGLEHALWNLAINARHAMADEGGVLSLTTGIEDDHAWVAVADTGCGIEPELQARIFDPYFTTKAPGEGTGLGLTAVERFVRASQGQVRVRSKPGSGATFVLLFPIAAAPARGSEVG
ncbi:MAG: sensor histidine kinase [Planctomycetota bacterium]